VASVAVRVGLAGPRTGCRSWTAGGARPVPGPSQHRSRLPVSCKFGGFIGDVRASASLETLHPVFARRFLCRCKRPRFLHV
jgi:hypothetical protein